MATLITGDDLRNAVDDGSFIKGGEPNCVEGVKYDFRMSPRILKSSFGTPIDMDKLTEQERAQVKVEPGEVVFVQTMERLALSNKMIAVLSAKRKLSHQGIIVLGGFCIDPNYIGPLFIGLYNFSSTPFPLQSGRKLIAALFYELSGSELAEFPLPEASGEEDFPEELVTLIRNYKPVELKSLTEAVTDAQKRLDSLTAELRDDRSWKRDVEESLERQNRNLERLIAALDDEKNAREREDERIKSRLDNISTIFTSLRVVWVILGLLIAAVLGGLAREFIPKMFH